MDEDLIQLHVDLERFIKAAEGDQEQKPLLTYVDELKTIINKLLITK